MYKIIFTFFSKVEEDKYWSKTKLKWVTPFKFKILNSIFNINPTKDKYQVKNYPIVYTTEEILKKYPNRWSIPTSPEILVKHNGCLLKITELKEIYV